jgi:poly(3-hydroxybutyrate) depolymerase
MGPSPEPRNLDLRFGVESTGTGQSGAPASGLMPLIITPKRAAAALRMAGIQDSVASAHHGSEQRLHDLLAGQPLAHRLSWRDAAGFTASAASPLSPVTCKMKRVFTPQAGRFTLPVTQQPWVAGSRAHRRA